MDLSVSEAWGLLMAAEFGENDPREKAAISKWLLESKFGVSEAALRTGGRGIRIDKGQLLGFLQRLERQEPIQYIIGSVPFFNCQITVGPGVLIPRPETEELAFRIVQETHGLEKPVIWDICSGSGCLAIGLAKKLSARAIGFELSEAALQISQKNQQLNQVAAEFVKQDVFEAGWERFPQPSIMVSNPPYVPETQKLEMKENVLAYEPEMALFVPDQDPLLFYRRISGIAFQYLPVGGKLYFEINEKLGEETAGLVSSFGFRAVELWQDWSGKDRFVKAVK